MNTANFDAVLQTVIYVLVAFVIPAVGYFLSNYLHESGTHVADQRKRAVVMDLVKSAEQTLSGDGQKRAYVESTLERLVPGISSTQAHSLIEASVLALHTDLGISSHTFYDDTPANPDPTTTPEPPVVAPPPVLDQASLVSDLMALVAPSLAPQVAQIVSTHVNPPVDAPPVSPVPSEETAPVQ